MKSSVPQRHLAVALAVAGVLLSVLSTEAYVYFNPDSKSPDQDGHCYHKQTQITFPVGETRQLPGRCERMGCDESYTLIIAGCGALSGGPGVIITKTDYSKPYPACCPQLVLSSENLI